MNEWLDDFKTATAFLTRLPMPHPQGPQPPNFVRAHRMFPVVGALIGAAVGLICLGLRYLGVPDLAAAALALGASAILTGALHAEILCCSFAAVISFICTPSLREKRPYLLCDAVFLRMRFFELFDLSVFAGSERC